MKKEDFLNAGFIENDDPQFKFEYSLYDNQVMNFSGDPEPALLYDVVNNQFCVTDGELVFIYINVHTPFEAISWANKIARFEDN